MNITFNTNTPIIFDFLRVIMYKHNAFDISEKYAQGGYAVSDRVTQAFDYIWDSLDTDVPGVELFFHYTKEARCYMFKKFDNKIYGYKDINELVEKAFEGPIDDLRLSLLEYYDNEGRDRDFLKKLMTDDRALYSHITDLDLSVKCRWELYMMFRDPDEILDPLKEFCHRIKRCLRNVYKMNNEAIQAFHKEMNVKIKSKTELLVNTELSSIFYRDFSKSGKDIDISYSFINEVLTSLYSAPEKDYIILGIDYINILENYITRESSELNDVFLKVFSDKHRMGIFRLLLNQEMYVRQISTDQKMNLSTTSYHLDLLLGAGVLNARPQGKRIYYSVHKEKVSDRLIKIAELIKKGTY